VLKPPFVCLNLWIYVNHQVEQMNWNKISEKCESRDRMAKHGDWLMIGFTTARLRRDATPISFFNQDARRKITKETLKKHESASISILQNSFTPDEATTSIGTVGYGKMDGSFRKFPHSRLTPECL
jgi:hypothetical protein